MNDKQNRRIYPVPASQGGLPRGPFQGRHYKLSPQSRSMAIDLTGQPYVDRGAMSARAIISTATVDRVGDMLIPQGCRLTNYDKNPVVLWAHGLEGIGQPIATSRGPDGNLGVSVSKDDVQATAWFSQSLLEAAQIFELIDEGIVRATSVRETPLKSRIEHDPEVGEVLIVEEWDLEEWSWCAVGINPDAVAKALNRNRLSGHPIVASIAKSLIAVAPNLRRLGVGLPTEKNMADMSQPVDEGPSENEETTPIPCDDDQFDARSSPYGATVVSAAYASLASACQNIEDALGPLENPSTKDGLQAILSSLNEQLTALEGLYATNYPDQPALKSDDDDGGGDDGDDAALKAFLAAGQIASLRVSGLGARLKGLIGARNLTFSQRQTLAGVTQQLATLVTQSKSRQSRSDEAKVVALQKSIQELTGLVGNITK